MHQELCSWALGCRNMSELMAGVRLCEIALAEAKGREVGEKDKPRPFEQNILQTCLAQTGSSVGCMMMRNTASLITHSRQERTAVRLGSVQGTTGIRYSRIQGIINELPHTCVAASTSLTTDLFLLRLSS